MKSIAFIMIILSITMMFSGCADSSAPTETTTTAQVEALSEPLPDTMDMTIAPTIPSGIPIEPGRCFYAYDENDDLYRVLWEQTDALAPEAEVQVDYHSLTKLEYPDGYPDGGYTPQYEITAAAVTVLQAPAPQEAPGSVRSAADDFLARRCDVTDLSGFVISTVTDERGKSFVEYAMPGGYYLVAVSAAGEAEYVFDGMEEYAHYLPLATPEAIRQADERLSAQLPTSDRSSGAYFSVDDEGCLCLNAEVIVALEPPEPDENGLVMSGCGIDHDHLFFSEIICSKP